MEKFTLKQKEDFETYYNFLIQENEKYNLTAITNKDEVFEKHFLDCVMPQKFFTQNASVIDVGSGAGFPAIPLKIVRPDLNITMIDSLAKRVNFLNEICKKLCFNNYFALHFRAEDYAKQKREFFDYATARAVAPLSTLCEYLAPFVKIGGFLIVYKGSNYEEEINNSQNTFKTLNLELKEVFKYHLQNADQDRVVLIIKKLANTPLKYPRGQNKPRTMPLN